MLYLLGSGCWFVFTREGIILKSWSRDMLIPKKIEDLRVRTPGREKLITDEGRTNYNFRSIPLIPSHPLGVNQTRLYLSPENGIVQCL